MRAQDIWDFTEQMSRQAPLTRSRVETLLGVPLRAVTEVRSEGGPATLGPNVTVTRAIAADNNTGWIFATFDVTTPDCVTLGDIRQRYPNVEVAEGPSPFAPDPAGVWSSQQPWGKLRFAITVTTKCLVSIEFVPGTTT
ncbi:hypothetical protein GCM10027167_50370 [Nocardia heshunensis]